MIERLIGILVKVLISSYWEIVRFIEKLNTMKKLLLILLCIPIIGFGQTQKIDVTVKKTPSISESFNEGLKAGAAAKAARAAQTAAAAEAEKARAAKAAAMSAIGAEIIVDLTVDLNNYTHLALVDVVYADDNNKKYSGKSQYENFANLFSSSPLAVINPFKENKRTAKKNNQFLKETKNPSWLYVYYETSIVGVDSHRSFVVRDSKNQIMYRGKYVNTPKSDMVSPFVFY